MFVADGVAGGEAASLWVSWRRDWKGGSGLVLDGYGFVEEELRDQKEVV